MANLTLLKSFTRRDDRARVSFYRRDDGFCGFAGDERVVETRYDGATYECWEARHESGIYQSLEAAPDDWGAAAD